MFKQIVLVIQAESKFSTIGCLMPLDVLGRTRAESKFSTIGCLMPLDVLGRTFQFFFNATLEIDGRKMRGLILFIMTNTQVYYV